MTGSILVGQSGGPTAVINASLAGVVEAAAAAGFGTRPATRILGMRFAIEGFLEDRLVDLGRLGAADTARLAATPGSALGSCRYKLRDEDLPRIHEALARHDVRYLAYIGGNDTMDTIHRICAYCADVGYEIHGIGVPKTVDNDLYATDHTPGYPSAARWVALSVAQGSRLARDMQRVDRFVVHQTVGRDAGWLAAASALGRRTPHDGPHLIYVPERPLSRELVLAQVREAVGAHGFASIVIGEGTRWEDGTPVSAGAVTDSFNNTEYGAMSGASAAINLHQLISAETGLRGEFQVPESLPMAGSDRRAPDDAREAWACGAEAVRRMVTGESGVMITIQRTNAPDEPYRVRYGTAPLEDVAVRARPMPEAMISDGYVTQAFLDYAGPLVGPLEDYFDLGELGDGAPEGTMEGSR